METNPYIDAPAPALAAEAKRLKDELVKSYEDQICACARDVAILKDICESRKQIVDDLAMELQRERKRAKKAEVERDVLRAQVRQMAGEGAESQEDYLQRAGIIELQMQQKEELREQLQRAIDRAEKAEAALKKAAAEYRP